MSIDKTLGVLNEVMFLTGVTPQRREFHYPRVLDKTQRHSLLLQDFRKDYDMNMAMETPLPDDSFTSQVSQYTSTLYVTPLTDHALYQNIFFYQNIYLPLFDVTSKYPSESDIVFAFDLARCKRVLNFSFLNSQDSSVQNGITIQFGNVLSSMLFLLSLFALCIYTCPDKPTL